MRRGQRSCFVRPPEVPHEMNAIDLLKKQHKEVKSLFKKMADADSARECRQLLDEIASRLEGHTAIEEEIFYPEDRHFEAKMTVLSELVEHHVEDEEKEMFKLAQKLGKDELESLGEQMEERFEAFRQRASEAA